MRLAAAAAAAAARGPLSGVVKRGGLKHLLRSFAGVLLVAANGAAFSQSAASAPAAGPRASAVSAATAPLDVIRGWFGASPAPADLLPPEQAFQVAVRARDADTLIATLAPARDYYLYRDRVAFTLVDAPGVTIASVKLPKGEPKADPTFGTVEVFHREFEAVIVLNRTDGAADRVNLRTSYQGCNEPLGVCYPPDEKTITLSLARVGSAERAPPAARQGVEAGAAAGRETWDPTQGLFAANNTWTLVAGFFGFGLLLAFTPCMLPMIPILSGIIVGHGHSMTRRHAVTLSLVYVLAMAATYALAGVAAGLAGSLLSAYLQSPWVLASFAAIFVLLALSMFGFYELQLPRSMQSALASLGQRIPGGGTIGALLMGVLSAVIVGPCVAAPLAGALLYIGQTRDAVLGGVALFSMAVGMGVPLLAVGATAGIVLPKAGPWMESIKRAFGVAMLGVALYMVSPIIPQDVQQLLWAALLIVPAICLSALDPLPASAPRRRRLAKGIAVMALVAGIALMIGAMSGGRGDLFHPLAGVRVGEARAAGELPFQPVKTLVELDARIRAANGRPVMLDFWAEWCVSCKEMERFTFSDPKVQARLQDVLLLRADVTANNADDQALLRRFKLFGPPGIVFFDRQGREVSHRVIGYEPAGKFMISLERALGRSDVATTMR